MKIIFLLAAVLSGPVSALGQSIPVGTSLLVNKGFENGLASWTVDKSNNSLNTTTALSGSTSLRLTGSPGGRAQIISTRFEAGAKYRVSGTARVSNDTDIATIGIEFWNADNKRILNQWTQVQGTAQKLYSFDIQAPNGTALIHLYVFKNSGNQPVDFDDMDLVKIANP